MTLGATFSPLSKSSKRPHVCLLQLGLLFSSGGIQLLDHLLELCRGIWQLRLLLLLGTPVSSLGGVGPRHPGPQERGTCQKSRLESRGSPGDCPQGADGKRVHFSVSARPRGSPQIECCQIRERPWRRSATREIGEEKGRKEGEQRVGGHETLRRRAEDHHLLTFLNSGI